MSSRSSAFDAWYGFYRLLPDEEELVVARAAVAAVRERLGPTAYGRVDLVRDDDRRPRVLELELVEPSLLLSQADLGAPDRLAAALTR